MQAKKCDRCGALYEDFYTPDLTVKKYNHPYGETRIDLCPECNKQLEVFLFGNSKNKDPYNELLRGK